MKEMTGNPFLLYPRTFSSSPNLFFKPGTCFLTENEVIRVWFLRVFVVCGFLRFLKTLVVLKNVSSNLIGPTNPNAVTLYRGVALKAFLFSEMTRRVIN